MSGSAQSDRRLALGGLVTVAGLAIVVLQAAGTGELSSPPLTEPGGWSEWLSGRDPLVAAMALLRLAALATAWYLLGTAVLGLALRLLSAARLVSVADTVTLPAVRRLLVSVAGVTMASGVGPSFALAPGVLTPGPQLPAAVAPPAPSHAAAAGQPHSPSTTTVADEPARPPPTVTMRLLPADGPPAVLAPPAPAAPTRQVADATTWRVKPGECFWSIAEDVLAQARGRAATEAEIASYWRALIEVNRGALADRSNPDLVYPGQVFTVPAVPR